MLKHPIPEQLPSPVGERFVNAHKDNRVRVPHLGGSYILVLAASPEEERNQGWVLEAVVSEYAPDLGKISLSVQALGETCLPGKGFTDGFVMQNMPRPEGSRGFGWDLGYLLDRPLV